MDKHIFKPSSFFADTAVEVHSIPDPFSGDERSKTLCHKNRFDNIENSQKSAKIEATES